MSFNTFRILGGLDMQETSGDFRHVTFDVLVTWPTVVVWFGLGIKTTLLGLGGGKNHGFG